MTDLLNKLSEISAPTSDPADARRRRLLNRLLLATGIGTLFATLLLLILPAHLIGSPADAWTLRLGTGIMLLGEIAVYLINRYLSGWVAGVLFLLLIMGVITVGDEPVRVVDGRSLFFFAIPILAAGSLLRPWASFAVAGVSSLIIAWLGMVVVGQPVPNLAAMAGFFILAAVAYLSARSRERALDRLHRANDALATSEEKYRRLTRTARDVILAHDLEGRITYANSTALRLSGYSREEFMSRSILEFVPPDQHGLVRQRREKRVAGNDVRYLYQTAFLAKDGRRIPVEVSSSPLLKDGDPTGVLLVARDITERLQAEQERDRLLARIREQARRLEEIVNTVPEGVILLTADKEILLVNPVAERDLRVLSGARIGDVLTNLGERPLTEFLTSPPAGRWHEVAAEDRIFEVIARPIEAQAQTSGWVLVCRDVTQERAFQDYTQQQERLAAVGQLAAGIAHDFNNIMTVVLLYTQLGLRTPALSPDLQQRLETIHRQAHRATDLIQQILDFSRRAVLERCPMDLKPFLKEQVRLLERTLREDIRISLRYAERDYTVNADPTRMQQVIMNLALNARDAMPEGGDLCIELDRLKIARRKETPLPEMTAGEWVSLTVSDTGTGISAEALPYVFDPFFSTKRPGKGSGLGLAQVHGIVAQHEGHITVATQVGEGTVFTIYLPAVPSIAEDAGAPEMDALPRGEGEVILVVEDNSLTREALVDALKLQGYRVLEAANGREALKVLAQYPEIALVISDAVMPEMGGIALFHALRRQTLALPMVLLSGHPADEREIERLRAEGLSGWLSKPPDLERLTVLIGKVLREDRVKES